MPRKVTDESGEEIEVPDQAELDALKATAAEAEATKAKLKEFEEDEGKTDWREARRLIKEEKARTKLLEEELAKSGKRVGEDGKITEDPKPLAANDIDKRIEKVSVDNAVEDYLDQFNDKDREVLRRNLDRVTNGQEVNRKNIRSFLDDAEALSRISRPNTVRRFANAPVSGMRPASEEAKTFDETDSGKGMYNSIFPNNPLK